jgi:signal transduction histidine kinase
VDKVIAAGRSAGLANHTVLIARDGSRRPIDDSAAPIRDDEGRFVGVVLVFRDVTERRRLEGELQRRSEALQDADRRKDEFLAMLAHELRNPLAPIRNMLQVLKRRLGADQESQQVGEVMERQLGHLVRLVEDLMDVSRITRGKVELRREPVALSVAVSRALEAARPLLEERQHALEVALPPEEVTLDADPAWLEQILSNLLTNAAKYTPPGGHVRLSANREGAQAVVRVRDDGIGIRREMMPRLFEMFQQADRVPGRVSEAGHRPEPGAEPGRNARRIGDRLERGPGQGQRVRRPLAGPAALGGAGEDGGGSGQGPRRPAAARPDHGRQRGLGGEHGDADAADGP